jgi:hypothetical protein
MVSAEPHLRFPFPDGIRPPSLHVRHFRPRAAREILRHTVSLGVLVLMLRGRGPRIFRLLRVAYFIGAAGGLIDGVRLRILLDTREDRRLAAMHAVAQPMAAIGLLKILLWSRGRGPGVVRHIRAIGLAYFAILAQVHLVIRLFALWEETIAARGQSLHYSGMRLRPLHRPDPNTATLSTS